MNTVQEQWERFSTLCIPKDAPTIQFTEMRRAYYAGVAAMLRIQWHISDGSVSEDGAIAVLEGIHEECRLFAEAMKRGEA